MLVWVTDYFHPVTSIQNVRAGLTVDSSQLNVGNGTNQFGDLKGEIEMVSACVMYR